MSTPIDLELGHSEEMLHLYFKKENISTNICCSKLHCPKNMAVNTDINRRSHTCFTDSSDGEALRPSSLQGVVQP